MGSLKKPKIVLFYRFSNPRHGRTIFVCTKRLDTCNVARTTRGSRGMYLLGTMVGLCRIRHRRNRYVPVDKRTDTLLSPKHTFLGDFWSQSRSGTTGSYALLILSCGRENEAVIVGLGLPQCGSQDCESSRSSRPPKTVQPLTRSGFGEAARPGMHRRAFLGGIILRANQQPLENPNQSLNLGAQYCELSA